MKEEMMGEKDRLAGMWEQEFQTTIKVLKELPEKDKDLRPGAKSRSALDLAWAFPAEEKGMAMGAIKGDIDFNTLMDLQKQAPKSMADVIKTYLAWHSETMAKFNATSEKELNQKMKFMTSPGKSEDVRRMDILWMMLLDQIHHRGQFSVYLRIAGAKVPSIYGPSADEPWVMPDTKPTARKASA